MRKNGMMRVAVVLLTLTLITSCFVGGTFAKYTTSADGYDTARVAHWGFGAVTENTLEGLFNTSADTGVLSSNGDNIIAPGTGGEITFTFVNETNATTAPEVAYEIIVSTDASDPMSAALEAQLRFTLDGGTELTWSQLLAAIEDLAYTDGSNQYAAGTPVPAAFGVGATHKITWKWSFDANDDDSSFGNKEIGELEKIKLHIDVTVNQLDTYSNP